MEQSSSFNNIYPFKDVKSSIDPILNYDKGKSGNVLIIDNGSYNCRMGWDTSSDFETSSLGSNGLVFKSVMVKTRKEKGKESELHVANDIPNIETVRYSLKTPFDRNIVTQFEHEEVILDYGFHHLGIEENSINHPIVISEASCNPTSSRASMNELLFENYLVPKVTYGIDGLFSLYKNQPNFAKDKSTAMVISLGFHSIHFMPVVNGKIEAENMRRLNVGGFHLTNFLHRGLQLKYNANSANITIGRAEEVLFNHCYVAKDFGPELRLWSDVDYYQNNVHKMQLPFTVAPKPVPVDPEVLKQRRQEMAKRLVEMNAKKREEKLHEDEALLKTLHTCLELLDQGYEEKVKRILAKHEIILTRLNDKELEIIVEKTKQKIEKARNPGGFSRKKDKPDEPEAKKRREDMTEDGKREFDSWLDEVKAKRQEMLDKRSARHVRKQQLSKRRTAASQERMRMISQLAKVNKKEDTFGMNDDDWDVYNTVRKDQGDSDSEEEQQKLTEYEAVLREHDPNFDDPNFDGEISRDSPEWYQLHLATERLRAPEIYFQPSIIGCDQAGISETLDFILKKYDHDTSASLASNVFVTGAAAKLPGLMDRISNDLISNRPFKSTTGVTCAENLTLDGFRGMQKFAQDFIEVDSVWITKSEYEEKGGDILKVHCCSNR